MIGRVRSALPAALAVALLSAPASAEENEERKLAVFPVLKQPGVPTRTWQTVDDAIAAEANFAAQKRGYTLVPLRKVSGVEQEAAKCADAGCRAKLLERLGADFALVGSVYPEGRDYQVELWLEGQDGQVVALEKAQGRMFMLTARIPDLASSVLEAGSSREAVARERLAKTAVSYERAGRPKDAARTYARAVALNPFHAEAARLSIKILHVWERAGDLEKANEALNQLIETYGPQSPWGQAGLGGPEVQAEVGRAVMAFLVREGTRQHEASLKLAAGEAGDEVSAAERNKALEAAFKAYERASALYPDGSVDGGEVAFRLAEVAYELGEYDEALTHYQVAARQGPEARQQEAAIGVCFSFEGVMSKKGIYNADKSHKVPARPKAVPKTVKAYLDAIDALIERFPTAKDATVFSFRAAQAELSFGRRDEAKARLNRTIALAGDDDTVARAQKLLGKL